MTEQEEEARLALLRTQARLLKLEERVEKFEGLLLDLATEVRGLINDLQSAIFVPTENADEDSGPS